MAVSADAAAETYRLALLAYREAWASTNPARMAAGVVAVGVARNAMFAQAQNGRAAGETHP